MAMVAVDLHCHILPGLDDGARDMVDAVAMAQQAQDDGISAICATPHIRHDHRVEIPELPSRHAQLRTALSAAGITTRILPGGEVAVSALADLDRAALQAVSLGGGGRWVLLEPDPGGLDDRLDGAVSRLAALGFRAVIAHPERHVAPGLVARLQRLIGRGALVQVTAAFLADEGSRAGMLALAAAGVVHVLGSDSHSSRAGRPVALSAGADALSGVPLTRPHLDWITDLAPRAITQGQELMPPFAG
jgi:protein-tyrosine phosphatase